MRWLCIALALSIWSCKPEVEQRPTASPELPAPEAVAPPISYDYDTSRWTELLPSKSIALDLRYASRDNFTDEQIYPCPRCFLHPDLARRILQLAGDIHQRYGWQLKLFDCYRPRPAQQRLWDIVPNASYVTPPHKGSMHNRGLAVDLTLVDSAGIEMDMGTEFDFFGRAAHTDHTDLDPMVLHHRKILYKLMELHGLSGIRTEWWHYSLRDVSADLSDWEWNCDPVQ